MSLVSCEKSLESFAHLCLEALRAKNKKFFCWFPALVPGENFGLGRASGVRNRPKNIPESREQGVPQTVFSNQWNVTIVPTQRALVHAAGQAVKKAASAH
jgi:hypothetical protein